MDSEEYDSFQSLDLLKSVKNAPKPSSIQTNTTEASLQEVTSKVLPYHTESNAMSPVELPLTEATQLPNVKRTGNESNQLPREYDSLPVLEALGKKPVTPKHDPPKPKPKPKPKPTGIQSSQPSIENVTKNTATPNLSRRLSSSSDSDLAKRLVIAIDYGTTFTGTRTRVS
jgi:hypothetical protein